MKYPSLSIAAVFSLAFALSAHSQNLLTNGDFETPPFAPSTTVTGWTVSGGGHIHEAEEGATSPIHSVALNIGGDSQGTILSQTFSTVAGKAYTLDFDAGYRWNQQRRPAPTECSSDRQRHSSESNGHSAGSAKLIPPATSFFSTTTTCSSPTAPPPRSASPTLAWVTPLPTRSSTAWQWSKKPGYQP